MILLEAELEKKIQGFHLRCNGLRVGRQSYNVLLGPNGAGKSLTLKLLAGFIRPDKGRILLDTKDISSLPPQGRDIIYLPQGLGLFPHLSVWENLIFSFKARGTKVPEERIKEVVEELELQDLLQRRPHGLSGGESQRVALARAILASPKLLLLDEPFSALDFLRKQDLIPLFKELPKRFGLAIIHVTHDPVEARLLSENIFVFEAGTLIFSGTWNKLLKWTEKDIKGISPYLWKINQFFDIQSRQAAKT